MGGAARGHRSGPLAPDDGETTNADVDLDALDGPASSSRTQASRRATPGRRRLQVIAAVILSALLGAALGAVVTGHRATAVARDERAALILDAGLPTLVRGTDPGTAGADGTSPVTVAVPLLNRGPRDVEVTVLGLDAPHQRLAGSPPVVEVDGAGTASALVDLDVDCAEHLLLASSAPAPGPSRVRVRLDLPTGPRETTLLLAQAPRMDVGTLLTQACAPPPQRRSAQEARWVPRADGRLVVTVDNVLRTTPVVIDLRETPGLGVMSDPPLPMTVPALGNRDLTLTIDPDCAVVGTTVSGTSSGTFDLVAVVDGVVQSRLADDEESGRAVWLARQLALRCG